MSNIVTTCIVLHNLCMVTTKGLKIKWIVESKNQLARIVGEK